MEFGVFNFEIVNVMEQTGKSFYDVCREVRGMGYKYVEIDLDELDLDKLLIFRENILHISSIYCFLDFAGDVEERIAKLLKMAYLADVHFVMPIPVRDDTPELKAAAIARLGKLCGELAAIGVQMVMEDFDGPGKSFATSSGLKSYLDAIPACRCCFDTGNFIHCGENVEQALAFFRKDIVHIHAKDRRNDEKYGKFSHTNADGSRVSGAPVGCGILPLEKIVKSLVNDGFEGIIIAEHSCCSDQQAALLESITNLKKWCGQE